MVSIRIIHLTTPARHICQEKCFFVTKVQYENYVHPTRHFIFSLQQALLHPLYLDMSRRYRSYFPFTSISAGSSYHNYISRKKNHITTITGCDMVWIVRSAKQLTKFWQVTNNSGFIQPNSVSLLPNKGALEVREHAQHQAGSFNHFVFHPSSPRSESFHHDDICIKDKYFSLGTTICNIRWGRQQRLGESPFSGTYSNCLLKLNAERSMSKSFKLGAPFS
jgi:hypothetical protein